MPSAIAASKGNVVPLCVDLDGTLINTDVLWESFVQLLRRNPLYILMVPFWLLRGRAFLKKQIASRAVLDIPALPYNSEFLEFLRSQKKLGRTLILTTAADHQAAERVAGHLGLFSEIIASNGSLNLKGRNKCRILVERFGSKGFDYAGDSKADLSVWEEAREAIVVNANQSLAKQAEGITKVRQVFGNHPLLSSGLFKALRPHQWLKNLIIFVPLITSHRITHIPLLREAVLAFLAFCFCASGVYLLNDILDLNHDRHHARKKFRPLASGQVRLPVGMILIVLMLAASALVTYFLQLQFAVVLASYFLLTTSYSWKFKRVALLDVFFLAGLYTIRLIAGHTATGIEYSFWLLAFSMFIFLSLALVKRFTELFSLRQEKKLDSMGRGYTANDLELVAMMGIATGCMAVLVLALYVNSQEVRILYQHPTALLMICPLFLYWISRVWLLAHRGLMHDDPVVFTLKDGPSYITGILIVGVIWLATGH
jgi:4-hydroxybenzoate polyprenyltransferase